MLTHPLPCPALSDQLSAAQLVGWVIEVEGLGRCSVMRIAPKLPGATTCHVLMLPNGRQTKMALARHGNGKRPFQRLHRVGEEPEGAAAAGGAVATATTLDQKAALLGPGGAVTPPLRGIAKVERNLDAAKESLVAAIAQTVETQEDLAAVHSKSKKLKKAALKFRELGLLQNQRMRHESQSGVCRALTREHDVLGICFVDDDDAFSRPRRMWFLFMLIIMTAGVTLAVAAYALDHEEDAGGTPCGDWCQIGVVMLVSTVFKFFARTVLEKVLPNSHERSLPERKKLSRCARNTRWVVGLILLAGLLLSGFIALVLGIVHEEASAGLLGVKDVLKVFFSSLLLNQVYDVFFIVTWYWLWDRRCGTRIDPELREIEERARRLEQESISSSLNDSEFEEHHAPFVGEPRY